MSCYNATNTFNFNLQKDIIETAKTVNCDLMKLVVQQKQQLACESVEDSSGKVEAPLMDQLDNQLDLKSLVMVLTRQIKFDSIQTRIAVLKWIYHLLLQIPDKVSKCCFVIYNHCLIILWFCPFPYLYWCIILLELKLHFSVV